MGHFDLESITDYAYPKNQPRRLAAAGLWSPLARRKGVGGDAGPNFKDQKSKVKKMLLPETMPYNT